MKAAYFRRYGSSEVLEIGDRESPTPGAGECLVKVLATSVNPIDWKLRRGMLRIIKWIKLPFVPGADICGEVIEVDPGVQGLQVGDRVYGMLDITAGGGYAEHAVLPETAATLCPEELSNQEAAALPLVGLAAIQVLRDRGHLGQNDRLLIIGASGGVGHVAVQIGKALGAHVTAVCSTKNVDWIAGLGADRVIDYKTASYHEAEQTYKVIFDVAAVDSYPGCSKLLSPDGVYVTTLPGPGIALYSLALPLFSKRRAYFFEVKPSREDLETLSQLVKKHGLRPKVVETYSLDQVKAAQERSESGRVAGKLVLDIA